MIGKQYWTTGILIERYDEDRWFFSLNFLDDGFCEEKSTEGTLEVRYVCPLEQGIDTLIADAKRMKIKFKDPCIYVIDDGEGRKGEYLPKNWKEIVAEQCKRLGWKDIYSRKILVRAAA